MRAQLFAAAAAGLVVCGCANQATLQRWKAESRTHDLTAAPALLVSSTSVAPSDPISVKTLPDRAAAAFIGAVAGHEKDSDKMRAELVAALKQAPSDVDQTKISRVLTIAVQRRSIAPADRYLFTEVEVMPIGFAFSDFQNAATEYNTISIGAIQISDAKSVGAQLSPTFGPVGAGGLTWGDTATTQSNRNVTEQQQLSVTATAKALDVVRTGGAGIDLTGNTLVKLSFDVSGPGGGDLSVFAVASPTVVDTNGKALTADKAEIAYHSLRLPAPRTLQVCTRARFTNRSVTEGPEFYDEGRQTVVLQDGVTPWSVQDVAEPGDLVPDLWVIQPAGNKDSQVEDLMVDTGVDQQTLAFSSFGEAEMLTEWIKKYASDGRIGSKRLGTQWDGRDMSLPKAASLHVSKLTLTASPKLAIGASQGACSQLQAQSVLADQP